MKLLFYYYYYFLLLLFVIDGFLLNNFDSAIGKWSLLYTTNIIFDNINNIELCIKPEYNTKSVNVKIKKYEYNGLITFTKILESNILETIDYDDKLEIKCGEQCCMIILNSEKYLKSIGMFDFPYFAIKYKSIMKPKCLIGWKVDKLLNRLYIYFDNHYYVFERNYYDNFYNKQNSITTDAFLITNIISFVLGKFLESTFHIK